MPVTRRKFAKCGHRGFGVECRRCGQAVALRARAEELHDRGDNDKAMALKEEAALLELPGKAAKEQRAINKKVEQGLRAAAEREAEAKHPEFVRRGPE